MIRPHNSAAWLMSNERTETGEIGLNFLPALYYSSVGIVFQGKVVVNSCVWGSNKITGNWIKCNKGQMRVWKLVSYAFRFYSFLCPDERLFWHFAHSFTLLKGNLGIFKTLMSCSHGIRQTRCLFNERMTVNLRGQSKNTGVFLPSSTMVNNNSMSHGVIKCLI